MSKSFEIGLVMAGAVSAGAYTAGVIDFLLQALNEWEKARESGADVPPHDVRINVVTGASAGGMTAAMLAAMINEEFGSITCLPEHSPSEEEKAKNKLYNAWVEQIDISKLLQSHDLQKPGSKVTSLLDSTVLSTIADSAIAFGSGSPRPSYIADNLHLYLTVTNLQGVPYDIRFRGRSGKGHTVSQHTDYFHFMLGDEAPESAETVWLNPQNDNHAGWNQLKNVALATGAFPGGLAPRLLTRPFSHYDLRSWPVPQRPDPDNPTEFTQCVKMETIAPNWPEPHGEHYHYLSVDGGVMDNEPLELARQALAGEGHRNPRSAKQVSRSVIMVDPFPSEKAESLKNRDELSDYDIVGVMGQLFGSLISQSRFKPDELMLANSDDVYSRFLIAPTRYTSEEEKAEYPIASGFLNGFGGFISKRFRAHDFQLGRRNCQQFLRRYFALPVEDARENPVFEEYTADDFEKYSYEKDGNRFIPIIPLLGEAKKEAKAISWQSLRISDSELHDLRNQVSNRTGNVVGRLIEQYTSVGLTRIIAKVAAYFKHNAIVGKAMNIIKKDLEEFDLKT